MKVRELTEKWRREKDSLERRIKIIIIKSATRKLRQTTINQN